MVNLLKRYKGRTGKGSDVALSYSWSWHDAASRFRKGEREGKRNR